MSNSSLTWSGRPVRAIVVPELCAPVILGLPWLEDNQIVIDASARTVTSRDGSLSSTPRGPPLRSLDNIKATWKDLVEVAAMQDLLYARI